MPPPVNPNFNPPPNTWQGGQFTMPPGVLEMLAMKQQQMQPPNPGMGMAPPPGVLNQLQGGQPQLPPNAAGMAASGGMLGLLAQLARQKQQMQP